MSIKEGVNHTYYSNGQVREEYIVVDNKKEGYHRGWDNNGKLVFECYYKDGIIDGLIFLYEEGVLKISKFENGKRKDIPINKVKEILKSKL